ENLTISFNRFKSTPTVPSKDGPKETAPEPPKDVAGDKPKRPGTKPEELIQGGYGVTEMSLDGSIHKAGEYRNTRVVFNAETFQILENGKPIVEAAYKLDFTKTPIAIDVKYLSGGKKGKTELGVIRVTDSMLEFTLAEERMPRPEEFNAYQGW